MTFQQLIKDYRLPKIYYNRQKGKNMRFVSIQTISSSLHIYFNNGSRIASIRRHNGFQ